MCNKEECGTPNASTPWCAACGCHTTEQSLKLHWDREHPPATPDPIR